MIFMLCDPEGIEAKLPSRTVSNLTPIYQLNFAYVIASPNIQSELNVNGNLNLLKFSLIDL